MPQARGDKEYLVPIRGLNTDQSSLHASQDFFKDGLNVLPDFAPLRLRRRLGLGSLQQVATQSTNDLDLAFSSFLWRGVNRNPDKNFLVLQMGALVYFIDADTDPIGSSVHTETIDLTQNLSGTSFGTAANARTSRCQFANAKGRLVVVNPACNPFYVEYDESTPAITITGIQIKVRDIEGVSDGLEVDERPATLSEDHEYNLYNQGWYKQRKVAAAGPLVDPINQFFTDKGVYPSNADIPHLAVVESSGELIFSTERLEELTFGSTPAPRGHYVLDAFNKNREALRLNPQSSGVSSGGGGSIPDDGTSVPPGGFLP
jgi:hypothetical protein